MKNNFNNPEIHTQSWYIVCKSTQLRSNQVQTISMLGKKITVYRSSKGTVSALDSRCPHLGADLGKGKVIRENIQCAFHHWEFESDGQCNHAPLEPTLPKRCAKKYPLIEKWGFIWIWNGPEVLFTLPEISSDFRVIKMPSQTIRCHPHLVVSNGLDLRHFSTLHGMEVFDSGLSDNDQFTVEVRLVGRPISKNMQILTGATDKNIISRFKTYGGNIALATVTSPINFTMLFTGNVLNNGHCKTQVIAFLPKKLFPDFFRALLSIYVLLHDDSRILNDIDYSPNFTALDGPMKKFVEVVNAMGTW